MSSTKTLFCYVDMSIYKTTGLCSYNEGSELIVLCVQKSSKYCQNTGYSNFQYQEVLRNMKNCHQISYLGLVTVEGKLFSFALF